MSLYRHSWMKNWFTMAEQKYPPLFQRKKLKNTIAKLVELTILFLCLALLGYRLLHLRNRGFIWLLAFVCESWFTFTWILVLNIKWTPTNIETYPERLQQQKRELPRLDMFVTTADPVLEPPIITVNTVISLLSVDYPVNKLACYVSDDAASPLTYYSLVEASKFAKLWVPFSKKYDIPVRAPFRYFDDRKLALQHSSTEFQRDFERMKDEYVNLCHKIEDAAKKPEPCNLSGDFEEFSHIDRKNHSTIIKVIWENKEDDGDGVPHLVYVSREKRSNHHHHYKAGAMNVLTRVSGVLTNAPFMVNVDCDMFVNNPQVVLHSMCLLLGDDERCGFVQFPQRFYDGLNDDPFGNQMVAMLSYMGRGLAGLQGPYYGGTGCFHRRKVIYGLSPNGKSSKGKLSFDNLEKTFGKAPGFNESASQTLSLSNSVEDRPSSVSDSMEKAFQVANCGFENNTLWGKKIGWIYGSTTEDVLTGMNIHARGWRSMWLATEPHGFLGCAPSCGPDTLVQQKRWSTGLLEIAFGPTGPISATLNGHMEFRQLFSYLWILTWGMRSIFEICYATLPAYCLITNTNFLPKMDEAAIAIPISIFLIFNLYSMWEYLHAGQSIRSWWNNQRMSRVITMTAWLFGFISVIIKLLGISDTVFEVTRKEQTTNNSEDDGVDQKLAGRFTFDGSPVFVPGCTVLVINLVALGCGFAGLINQGRVSGEAVCSVWVVLCFWSFLKGLFGRGKYGIPSITIYKSVGLGLVFLQFCRWSSPV